jgi:hypothetical protein
MEITGSIIQVLPLQTGEGRNGPWKKQDFVIETESQYPKKVCISVWGDKIEEGLIQVGNKVKASIEIESREYNGRWYTDVRAWRLDADTITSSENSEPAPAAVVLPAAMEGEDDLPF